MLRHKLAGVAAGGLLSILAMVGTPCAQAANSEHFLQDFAPAFALLHDMGLVDAAGAEYGVLENPNTYERAGDLFYDLDLKGGQWRLPGDRVLQLDGTVSDVPKLPGVQWKKTELKADVAALLKYLQAAEKAGYENISHQSEAHAKLIFFGAQLADQGMADEANRIVAHALAAARNPREPIRQALLTLAGGAYEKVLEEHLATANWSALADALVPLRERFGSAWDDSAAVQIMIDRLREQAARPVPGSEGGDALALPKGMVLSADDREFLAELAAATAAGFAQLTESDPAAGEQDEPMEPAMLSYGILGLFTAGPWWSKDDAAFAIDGVDSDLDEAYDNYFGSAAIAGLDLPSFEKWRELANRRFAALPLLLALAGDERFLPVSTTALSGDYDSYGGGGRSYSSSDESLTPEQRYAQMTRPLAMSELVVQLLRSLLPGAPGGSEDGEPDSEHARADLLAWGADFYLRMKDRPEVEITRAMFEAGGSDHALQLLCRQGGPEDFAIIEQRLLSGLSGGQNPDFDTIYRYLKARGDEAADFYQQVSTESKRQLGVLDENDWQRDQIERSMQRIDAMYSTETSREVLARVLAEDSEQSLDEVGSLLHETFARETRDVALGTVLDALLAHEELEARTGLLQVLSILSEVEYDKDAGELSPAASFGDKWATLLADERSFGDMSIGEGAAWAVVQLHEPDQVDAAYQLWATLGKGSLEYLRQRAVALSGGLAPPDFPDASSVDGARVAELEAALLAARGPAMGKVWDGMNFSEALAVRARLADANNPPQALLDHMAAQVWQVVEVTLPEAVAGQIESGDSSSPSTAAWKKLAALRDSELDQAKLTALFTDLLPIASHRRATESWQVEMSGGSGSGGVTVVVTETDAATLAATAESDQMLNYLVTRGLANPAAVLTVTVGELGSGIWLAPLADQDSGAVADAAESELAGEALPESYFEGSRVAWIDRLAALFSSETSGDPAFTFSVKIFLTTTEAIAAAKQDDSQ